MKKQAEELEVPEDELTLLIWHQGINNSRNEPILLRFATSDDKKLHWSERKKKSKWYEKQGNRAKRYLFMLTIHSFRYYYYHYYYYSLILLLLFIIIIIYYFYYCIYYCI